MNDPLPPPVSSDNDRRLEALRRYGILDTEAEEAFDGIARLAAHVCKAPIAVINFIDEGRQWFKSEIGLGVRQTPLDISICAHAILQPGLFIVPDTTKDERFACNPLVASDPRLRFYAGALLETADGHALGTLCVLDHVPRDLDEAQRDALSTLARQVMAQLELRRELAVQVGIREDLRRGRDAAERAGRALSESEDRKQAILDTALDAIVTIDHGGRVLDWNPAAERIFGHRREEALGREMCGLIMPPSMRDAHRRGLAHYLSTGEGPILGSRFETTALRANGAEFPVELAINRIPTAGLPTFTAYVRDITDRKRDEETIAEQVRLAEYGRDVGRALTQGGTLDEMLGRAAEATVRHLDGAFARVWTLDEAGEILELRASAGVYTHTDGPHSRIPVGSYKIGQIALERRPHLTNSVIGDPRIPAQDWARAEGMVAFAGYPLVVEDRLVGVLAMFARHGLSEQALLMMASVADEIAIGIDRKQAEERLHRHREWLRVTLASIGDAVIATDLDGRVTFLNAVAESLTGWTQAEAVGRPLEEIFRIVNEQTRREVESPAIRALREGVVVGLANHTILIARDGTERAIDDSGAPIRDEAGSVIGAVLIFRDIAERRRSELALEASERELADFFENATVGLHWVGPDGTILRANRAELELLGYEREEYVGRHIAEFHADQEVIGEILRCLSAGEALRDFPSRLRCKDGTVKDVLIDSSVLWEGDRFVHTRCFTRDVTERKRAEQTLRHQLELTRAITDNATTAIFLMDDGSRCVFMNPAAEAMTGFDFAEAEGRILHDLIHHTRPDGTPYPVSECPIDRALPERFEVRDHEDLFVRKDGTRFPVLCNARPIRGVDGRAATVIEVRDITERKRFEDELRLAKEEAEAANQAKTQFLAVLSHELRTPLNPILLAATSMLERPADPEQLRPTLAMIRQNVLLQARLIDDLLDVMRIVRGKMPLHWEVADCHSLIDQAVQVCRSEVLGHELRLVLELDARQRHVNADPARLQQVFWNLIRNAVKFTPEGGTVAIRTRNQAEPGRPQGLIVVEVSDSGIGIEPEVLPTVFDPFQQGETTITRKYGGLGLGLAICKGIVDAHGGTIAAESAGKGKGTTFRLVLKALPAPVSQGDDLPTPGVPRGDGTPPGSLRILVVDDEPATLRIMALMLRGEGHEVETAGTVAEAVRVFEGGDFDLIISDIGLPDATGLDLMRRAVALRGPLPAIALTGYGMEEDIRRSREAGFTAHLTKPIDFAKLEAMIRQVVP